jgi:hypothetical protein
MSYTTAQSGAPDAPVQQRLTNLTPDGLPGDTLASVDVPQADVSWSPSWVTLPTSVPVTTGEQFALVISSPTAGGCYAMAYADSNPYPSGGALYSNDGGATWHQEGGRDLHFRAQLS